MDKEQIKKALDDFENDEYTDSKETMKNQIKSKVNDYLKDKLELEQDPVDGIENNEE